MYEKLDSKIEAKVDIAIDKFRKNPLDATLINHSLKGATHQKRALSITGDIRIVFKEYDTYVLVLFLDIGSHNKVY